MPRVECACCGQPRRKMLVCQVCGASSHERCMRGRMCPCECASLVAKGDNISQTTVVLRTTVSARSGGRYARLDIVYDRAGHCLLLQATRPGQTIRIVSAGLISRTVAPAKIQEGVRPAGIWCSPRSDVTEFVWDWDHFWIDTDMVTGDVIVAASGMYVTVFPLHDPVVVDCRAPNTDTRTRRWLRLPWNDEVDRRGDAWLPRRITRFIGICAERVLGAVFD